MFCETHWYIWWTAQIITHTVHNCFILGHWLCGSAPDWCKATLTGSYAAHLRAVFDVVSFVEAKVAQVVWRRPFAGFACLWGQRKVWEMVRQRAQTVHDIVEGPVGWGALVEIVVQGLSEKKIIHQDDKSLATEPCGCKHSNIWQEDESRAATNKYHYQPVVVLIDCFLFSQ